MDTSSNHIQIDRLADLVEGRLEPGARAEVRAHLAGCPQCAGQVAWLERVIGLMRTDDRDEVPLRAAENISRAFAHRAQPPHSLPRRLRAALRFDSALLPQPLGRRAGPVTERQLVYSAEGVTLDLRVARSGALWAIAGQLLGERGGIAELIGPGITQQVALSHIGEFNLSPVPRGIYTLTLRLPTAEIEIAALEIGD